VSEPKRYQPVVQCVEPSYQAQMIEPKVMEFSEGEYVLHSDYARLKAEVERLRDGVETMTWNASGVVTTQWVRAVEYDRLKAEVERLTELNATLSLRYDATNSMLNGCAKEIEEMEAEVERLTSDLQMEKENEDRLVREWQKANNEVYGLQRQVAALIDDQTRLKAEVERLQSIHSIDSIGIEQLKAQVERLTKAGDAMMGWIDHQHDDSGYQHSEAWEAAKEGKQS
jgi:chromosome segregation ATPase